MPEQLYCNGKVIFLYNDLTPPAKQVGLGFEHFHFSEHEKLQCPQQAKAHTKMHVISHFPTKCTNNVHSLFPLYHLLISLHFLPLRLRRRQFVINRLKKTCQILCTVHVFHEKHILCPFVGRFVNAIRNVLLRRLHRLH